MNDSLAQTVLPSKDLPADMAFFTSLGFRLNNIYPSDNPMVAIMSGHGINIKIDKSEKINPPLIQILSDSSENIGDGKKDLIVANQFKKRELV